MDYNKLAQPYKPDKINVLLIGEAPPPNSKNYFYKVPDKYPSRNNSIEDDTSLPATIFNHYFGRRPKDIDEYQAFLICLRQRGVFLIDIIEEALVIREKDRSLNKTNIAKLVSDQNLTELKSRIGKLPVDNETKIIFLLARTAYLKHLKNQFKYSSFITWKYFRLDIREAVNCDWKTCPKTAVNVMCGFH